MANECRRVCGGHGVAEAGPVGVPLEDLPRSLTREPAATGVDEERRGGRAEPGRPRTSHASSASAAAPPYGTTRSLPPLPCTWASWSTRSRSSTSRAVSSEMRRPRAVEELEHRPVPQRRRILADGCVEQPLDLLDRQRLRQRPDRRRGRDLGSDVLRREPLTREEAVQAPRGDDGARDGRWRVARRPRGAPLPQPADERLDVLGGGLPRVVDPALGQVRRVGPQVTSVGLQGVVGEAALDPEVVEVDPDERQRGRPVCPPAAPRDAPTGPSTEATGR